MEPNSGSSRNAVTCRKSSSRRPRRKLWCNGFPTQLSRCREPPRSVLAMMRPQAVELYDKGGRAELAAQEREEIAIISGYLPTQMSEADMKAAIAAVIAETGAAGIKDMGKVIGVLKAKYAGQMDFGKASGMVKAA